MAQGVSVLLNRHALRQFFDYAPDGIAGPIASVPADLSCSGASCFIGEVYDRDKAYCHGMCEG